MPDLESVYLIAGTDRPKVEVAVQRLRAHFDAGSVDRFDASEADGATVVAACNAGTLLGDLRLVIVDQVDGRPGDDGRPRATWKAADVEAVVEYLRAPSPGTVLCLVATEAKKDAPLVKAVTKAGGVLRFDAPKKELGKWVVARFKAAGVPVDSDAVQLLLQLADPEDRRALALEVDKLITWASSDPESRVGEREVRTLVSSSHGSPPWELTDAWADHDPAAALRVVEHALHQAGGPSKRGGEAARLAAALAGHLTKLRSVARSAADGERPGDYAQRTKQHRFPVEKLFRQVEGMSAVEFDDATRVLARLDYDLKGGTKLPIELSLQRAVTALTAERGR